MKISDKDKQVLEHIVKYCDEIKEAHEIFDYNKQLFMDTSTYRNACSMPIMQIGELVKKLSTEYINADRNMPWKAIKGMRDIFAHDYHAMNKEMIWETSVNDIPALAKHVTNVLTNGKNDRASLNNVFTR